MAEQESASALSLSMIEHRVQLNPLHPFYPSLIGCKWDLHNICTAEEGQVFGCHTVDEWKGHLQKGVESKKLVVIDFTAAWCGPCRFISPIFTEYAKKFTHVIFLKVDVDELVAVAKEFKVEAMPTFLFLKDGQEVDRVVGAQKKDLEAKISFHGTVTTA